MDFSPPLPPPPPPSHTFHVPVIAIALIGIIATGILLISYYVFVIKCCLNLHRVDLLNRLFSRRRHLDVVATNATSPVSTPGLEEAVIRSIPVIKFRKSSVNRQKCDNDNKNNNNESEIECAVCLCEFEEGEKLRVIPNCCHAFHIDCIDIWLQSCANCPLCRSGISASSMLYNADKIKKYCNDISSNSNSNSNSNSSSRNSRGNGDNFSGDDDDYLVIEIQGNNLDEPRLINRTNSNSNSNSNEEQHEEMKGMVRKKLGHVCSMGDELIDSMRKNDQEFQVQPIRRSISMDLSTNRDFCIEVQQYCTSNIDNNMHVSEVITCSNSSSSSKMRRSIFSFGYGRSSKGAVQPIHLDS